MESLKKTRNCLKNDMSVLNDIEDDRSIVSSTTTSTIETYSTSLNIIVHDPRRLANAMSVDSDSDSDFVDSTRFTNKIASHKKRQISTKLQSKSHTIKVKVNTPQKNRKSLDCNSPRSRKSQLPSNKKLQNEITLVNTPKNIIKSPQKLQSTSSSHSDISNDKSSKKNPKIPSLLQNETKDTTRKSRVARNIFASTPATKKTGKCTGTQTNSESQDSSDEELISSSSDNNDHDKIDIEIQTENNVLSSTNTNIVTTTATNNLKRPHNVATQTETIVEIVCDKEKSMKKLTLVQVSPPKKLKTINEAEECPFLRLIDEHKNKIEAAKKNLFSELPSTSGKIKHRSENTQKSAVKNRSNKTPMKQLTITELNFCKNTNTTSKSSPAKSTVSTSAKSTPNTSPTKLKKTPEKKDTRYSLENNNRVFENVKKIVNWVFENNHFNILFTKAETDLLKKLFDLPDQRMTILCIRLYTRQHKWYNISNLCEELNLTYEGFNLRSFYTTLASCFVSTDYSSEKIELLLDYLTLPDIKDICRSFKIRVRPKKQDSINKLLEFSTKQCTLTSLKRSDQILRDRVSKKLGICVKLELNIKTILYRVHLLYSLTNGDLEIANDIYNLMNRIRDELVKYPKVQIDNPLLFSGRLDFLRYADACILRKEFNDQILKKDIASEHLLCLEAFKRLKDRLADADQIEFDKKKPLFLRRFSPAWVYCKVLSAGSQNLGKQYSFNVCEWLTEMLKQDIYCVRSRGYWHSQLALVTRAHKKDIVGEVQSIIDGLSDKHVTEVQKHELSIRGSKINKGKISQMLYDELQCSLLPAIHVPVSRTIQANVVHNNEPGRKLQYVRTTDEGKEYNTVEDTAKNYYTEEDNYTHGIHCEGQLLDALFCILFWDIMYGTHVLNTFITELQNKPLDLFSGEFYSNRTDIINTRLKNIRDDWTLDKICEFASNNYTQNTAELKSLTSFDFVQEDTIPVIIRCIGKKLLGAVLERFAKDYKQFHSGLPDLFMWNYKELKCCFVEVKSENDRLSTKQILWINYLHEFGAKVEVCHVEHIGSRSTKKIKPKNGKR